MQGLNTRKGFDVKVAEAISEITGLKFQTAPNKVRKVLPCILIAHVAHQTATTSLKPSQLTTPLLKPPVHSTLSLFPS